MKALLLVLLLSGCSFHPYVKLSGGHIVDQTPYWNDGGDRKIMNPCDASFRGEIGIEKRVSKSVVVGAAYTHNSNLDCGNPFDDFDEFHKEAAEISVKVGGV